MYITTKEIDRVEDTEVNGFLYKKVFYKDADKYKPNLFAPIVWEHLNAQGLITEEPDDKSEAKYQYERNIPLVATLQLKLLEYNAILSDVPYICQQVATATGNQQEAVLRDKLWGCGYKDRNYIELGNYLKS